VHYELVDEGPFARAVVCQVRKDVPLGGTRSVRRLTLGSIDGDVVHVEPLPADGESFLDDALNMVGPWLNQHGLAYKGLAAWRESRMDGVEVWQADVFRYPGR